MNNGKWANIPRLLYTLTVFTLHRILLFVLHSNKHKCTDSVKLLPSLFLIIDCIAVFEHSVLMNRKQKSVTCYVKIYGKCKSAHCQPLRCLGGLMLHCATLLGLFI